LHRSSSRGGAKRERRRLPQTSESAVWLRLLAALGALALGVAAVVIVAVLAHRTPGPAGATSAPVPAGTPANTATNGKPAFPAPPAGAVVFSRPWGVNVLALGVVPGRKLLLQASVVGGQGQGVENLPLSFRVGSSVATARPCGPGCYRARMPSPLAPRLVEVRVAGADPTTWRVSMPRQWPPPDASALVSRATRAFRKLRSFELRESLSSGPGQQVFSLWRIVAPDRLTYQIANGPAAVIIGNRRWDKLPGGTWEESEQSPVHQPTPFWVSWAHAHVLENTKSAWRVSFFDPKTPGWFDLLIAKRSLFTLEMQMHTTRHFMREVYGRFNAPFDITPPS
jgi:hypothetical protein